jgi:methylenetetrahydrofolate dehydrogenase (NADP+)/methenyltetrahydrofolate cyclohydrolase
MGAQAGVRVQVVDLPPDVDTAGAVALVAGLGADPEVDGVFVQFPLPAGVDAVAVAAAIPPGRDVDGSGPTSAFAPAAVVACLELLAPLVAERTGRRVALVGASTGRASSGPSPVFLDALAEALAATGATVVHTDAGQRDWRAVSRSADVVVSAAGVGRSVTAACVRPGAIVVDAGVSRVDGIVVGDVDVASVAEVAAAVVPSPGGLGPMTVALLLEHTVAAARSRRVTQPVVHQPVVHQPVVHQPAVDPPPP